MREGYTNPCVTRNNDYLRDSVLIEDTTSGGKNFLSGLINTPPDVCANLTIWTLCTLNIFCCPIISIS